MVKKVFMMKLSEIQPSQLYICSEKLSEVMKTFNRDDPKLMEPISVKKLGDEKMQRDLEMRKRKRL